MDSRFAVSTEDSNESTNRFSSFYEVCIAAGESMRGQESRRLGER